MFLYLDIETIPSQREDVKALIAADIKPPGNYKKQETIDKWMKEEGPAKVDEEWRKTALNGTYGEIICISFAIDDNKPFCIKRELHEPEKDLLIAFYELLKDHLFDSIGNWRKPIWVGHNHTRFDLRFIWQRSVINQVKPLVKIPYDAKPWDDLMFDTRLEWTGTGSYTSGGKMTDICRAFNLGSKGDIDGSKVWDYVLAGKVQEVADYCIDDVERTRLMHKAMTFTT